MKLKPLPDKILCTPVKGEAITKGGLILAESEEKRYWQVKAVGTDVLEIKPKDMVIFDNAGAEYFTIEGQEYASVSEWDVLAKVVE